MAFLRRLDLPFSLRSNFSTQIYDFFNRYTKHKSFLINCLQTNGLTFSNRDWNAAFSASLFRPIPFFIIEKLVFVGVIHIR